MTMELSFASKMQWIPNRVWDDKKRKWTLVQSGLVLSLVQGFSYYISLNKLVILNLIQDPALYDNDIYIFVQEYL